MDEHRIAQAVAMVPTAGGEAEVPAPVEEGGEDLQETAYVEDPGPVEADQQDSAVLVEVDAQVVVVHVGVGIALLDEAAEGSRAEALQLQLSPPPSQTVQGTSWMLSPATTGHQTPAPSQHARSSQTL